MGALVIEIKLAGERGDVAHRGRDEGGKEELLSEKRDISSFQFEARSEMSEKMLEIEKSSALALLAREEGDMRFLLKKMWRAPEIGRSV